MNIHATHNYQPAVPNRMPVTTNSTLFDRLATDGLSLSDADITEINRLEKVIQADLDLDDEDED